MESVLVAINPGERPVEVALPDCALTGQPEILYGDTDVLSRQGEDWLMRMRGVSACLIHSLKV